MPTFLHSNKCKDAPKNPSGNTRAKMWRFECPYCKKDFSCNGDKLKHFGTKSCQRAIKKFIDNPENRGNRFFQVVPMSLGHYSADKGNHFPLYPEILTTVNPPQFGWGWRGRKTAKDIYKEKLLKLKAIYYGAQKDNCYIYKYEPNKRHVEVIERFFLNVRWNPDFKYCRRKQMEELNEIMEEHGHTPYKIEE